VRSSRKLSSNLSRAHAWQAAALAAQVAELRRELAAEGAAHDEGVMTREARARPTAGGPAPPLVRGEGRDVSD
jgi:hypothetical protein